MRGAVAAELVEIDLAELGEARAEPAESLERGDALRQLLGVL